MVFQKPKLDDFERFIEDFEANQDKKLGALRREYARLRVFFKYRTQRLGWKEDDALTDLHENLAAD